MSLSTVPRPFHHAPTFPSPHLVTIDGTPVPLLDIAEKRQVVVAALDLDCETPSAAQLLTQLLLPVFGLTSRRGSAPVPSTTTNLQELLLCCDCYFLILTKEPVERCRALRAELATAAESFADGGGGGGAEPERQMPACIPIVRDEGAEALRQLQLVGLDGRTTPAVFTLLREDASPGPTEDEGDEEAQGARLSIGHRQFGMAFAGVGATLSYQLLLQRAAAERLGVGLLSLAEKTLPYRSFAPAVGPRAAAGAGAGAGEADDGQDEAEAGALEVAQDRGQERPQSLAESLPPPLTETILSHLLSTGKGSPAPAAVVAAMGVCRGWHSAGATVLNAGLGSAVAGLRAALPLDGRIAGCDEGLHATPSSAEEAEARLAEAYAEGTAFPWVPVAEIAERTTRLLCLLRWGRLKPGTAHVMPRILKEEGNAHFSRGQLALALRCYRSGLALCRPLPAGHPDAPVSVATRIALHANVAAVLLRLDDSDATVAEGGRALALGEAHEAILAEDSVGLLAKCRLRRAKAYLQQGKLPLAVRDLQRVLATPAVPKPTLELARATLDSIAIDGDATF